MHIHRLLISTFNQRGRWRISPSLTAPCMWKIGRAGARHQFRTRDFLPSRLNYEFEASLNFEIIDKIVREFRYHRSVERHLSFVHRSSNSLPCSEKRSHYIACISIFTATERVLSTARRRAQTRGRHAARPIAAAGGRGCSDRLAAAFTSLRFGFARPSRSPRSTRLGAARFAAWLADSRRPDR